MSKVLFILLTMPVILLSFALFVVVLIICRIISEKRAGKQTYYSDLDDLFSLCLDSKVFKNMKRMLEI